MKIKELIEKLSNLDPDLDVYRPGYEGGYEDIDSVFVVDIIRNYYSKEEEWWIGPHESVDIHELNETKTNIDFIPGLILR